MTESLFDIFARVHSPIDLSGRKGRLDDATKTVRDSAKSLGLVRKFSGGLLSDADCQILLQKISTATQDGLSSIAARFASGVGTLTGWAATTLRKLWPSHLAGLMARLGRSTLSGPEVDASDAETARQAAFLSKFRDDIASGRAKVARDGQPAPGFLARVRLYGAAVWGVAERAADGLETPGVSEGKENPRGIAPFLSDLYRGIGKKVGSHRDSQKNRR